MRTIGITGHGFDGADSYYLSIVDDGTRLRVVDVQNRDMGDPWDYLWDTLAGNRNATKDRLRTDGRTSADAVGMFRTSEAQLTNSSGAFAQDTMDFGTYVQSWFDEHGRGNARTSHGLTYEDRFAYAIRAITQRVWEE